MILTLKDAREFVRARIDEIAESASDMLNADPENLNLDKTTEEAFIEAVESVHLTAPWPMLEGLELRPSDFPLITISDGVIDMNLVARGDISILRLVSFKSADSSVVVTQATPEDSPVGRMQLDRYIRGRADKPCLVRMADSLDRHPHYRYYTTTLQTADFSMRYVPSATTPECFIASMLRDAVLNQLTGLVLISLGEIERGRVFTERASAYLNR